MTILRWLTLSLFAYFATLFVVHVSWGEFFRGLLWRHFSASKDFWLTVVAVLGTTISPYLFFWQASLFTCMASTNWSVLLRRQKHCDPSRDNLPSHFLH